MLFNSLQYALFLGGVLALYHRLEHRSQNLLLLLASYLFYASWDLRFLSLIWVSTIVDYLAARSIAAARSHARPRRARVALLVSLATNLGILGFFKYWGFFTESAQALLARLGVSIGTGTLDIVLPVGISFYTFQTLSYTIDVYRGRVEPVRSLPDFALFVAFFPQLVAGPIERAERLLPQLRSPRTVTRTQIAGGTTLIVIGLVRKVAIADPAGALADRMFADPARFTALQLAAGLVAYGLQIYGDFAGYSNIARGSSRLLGIELVRNFEHPYFARNPSAFWRRWHISLSTWLRDYVYIPLGGNRRGHGRTYLNLMATMLIGGLWHGAAWRFVVWGGLHGVYLAVHRAVIGRRPAAVATTAASRLGVGMSMLATFVLVHLAWIFFRAERFADAGLYLRGLVTVGGGGLLEAMSVAGLGLMTLTIDLPQHRSGDELWPLRLPPLGAGVLAGLACLAILLSGSVGRAFIYFQF